MEIVKIGTRASTLALWQARSIATSLSELYSHIVFELVHIVSTADAAPEVPLAELGTKGLFTKTLQDALMDSRVDIVVNSLKDMASVEPDGLVLAAIPKREDARDVFVSVTHGSLADLPAGARIGTSAPRRKAQLCHLRRDLEVTDIRGNVDSRLRKLRDGQYDAIVLAAAGIIRLGRTSEITAYFEPAEFVPAGGQGALGVEIRATDSRMAALTAPLVDREATICCTAERSFQATLEGGCRIPAAVLATLTGSTVHIDGLVASEDGARVIRGQRTGPTGDAQALGAALANDLLAQGAGDLLVEIQRR